MAIKPTLQAQKKLHQLKQVHQSITEAPIKFKKLQFQLDRINKLYFSMYDEATVLNQDYLLEVLNKIVKENHVQITHYPGEHTFSSKKLNISTHIITIKGSFRNLLKTLYQFENNYKTFKLASIKFYAELNRKTKLKQLYMVVFIQQINNTDKVK
jgi:hypothetical protein